MKIHRTSGDSPQFKALVSHLSKYQQQSAAVPSSGQETEDIVKEIQHSLLAEENGEVIGCAGIKVLKEVESLDIASSTIISHKPRISGEIRKMYVESQFRKKGVAGALISELESWSKELGLQQLVIETGRNQPENITLYRKHGFKVIQNYGVYKNQKNSICMLKML